MSAPSDRGSPPSPPRSPRNPPSRSTPRTTRLIERVLSAEAVTPAEMARIDEIATTSFEGQRFSMREEIERPWTRLWIARTAAPTRDEGELVGFLVAWHVADELHVLHVATAPNARRLGHGEALMRVSIRYAAENGVRMLLLEVRRSNRPAIKLYRKLGFTALGLRPRYYSDGEDAVEMVLNLDPTTGAALPGKDEVRLEV